MKILRAFIITLIIALNWENSFAQKLSSFKDENIEFKYPSSYIKSNERSDVIIFSAYNKDKEILLLKYPDSVPPDISAWTESLIKIAIRQMTSLGLEVVDYIETHLSNKSLIRCTKFLTNDSETDSKVIIYLFVANQRYYMLYVASDGKIRRKDQQTTIEDNIASRIKTIIPEWDVDAQLQKLGKLLNQKCPISLGDGTTFLSITVDDKNLIYKILNEHKDPEVHFSRELAIENLLNILQWDKEFIIAAKDEGWKFTYNIYNSNYELIEEEVIAPTDLINRILTKEEL